MKRRLAWAMVGLGLAAGACGRSSKNPEQNPDLAVGGCSSECSEGGTAPTNDAGGMPDAVAGTFSDGGTFSSPTGAAGAPSSAGAAPTVPMPDSCTAGEQRCVGNQVRTCHDGAFPETGMECGAMLCDGGTCSPRICLPGEHFCSNGDVHVCLATGTKGQLKKTCLSGTGCGEVPGTVDCVVLACEPDAVACVDNQIGTCASDGAALGSVSLDCAEQGKVCNAAGSCSPVAVDELGGSAQTQFNSYLFNVIDVRSARHVSKVELSLTAQQDDANVHWQIYQDLGDGSDAQVLAEADSVLLAGETSAATSELDYDLAAGQRYYVGATVDADSGVSAAYDVLGETQLLSFGLVNVPNSVAIVFAMRITTALPSE